ncbi:hypothetical protein ACL02O_06270 [Micromonospora sp. MS34]|uniref:hypothetical protein n=1 Tax=Micromonospora sp. MS34 TaxID=3385971 RepID=UPI0039A0CCE1
MDRYGHPEIARIDDTVTPENLHERAEQVAVPNFDYLNQTIEGIADGLTHPRHRPTEHD